MKPDQERVRNLLTDTVTLLCKNGLQYQTELRVQGVLGITLDNNDVFIVHINEKFSDAIGGTITLRKDEGDAAKTLLGGTGLDARKSQDASRGKTPIVVNSGHRRRQRSRESSASPALPANSSQQQILQQPIKRLMPSSNEALPGGVRNKSSRHNSTGNEGTLPGSEDVIEVKVKTEEEDVFIVEESLDNKTEISGTSQNIPHATDQSAMQESYPNLSLSELQGSYQPFGEILGVTDSSTNSGADGTAPPPTKRRTASDNTQDSFGGSSEMAPTSDAGGPFITGIIRNETMTGDIVPQTTTATSWDTSQMPDFGTLTERDSQMILDSTPGCSTWDTSQQSQIHVQSVLDHPLETVVTGACAFRLPFGLKSEEYTEIMTSAPHHLPQSLPSVATPNRTNPQQTQGFPTDMHSCPECRSVFEGKSKLWYHIRSKHSRSRLACSQCQCTFVSKAGLTQHVKHIHEKLPRYRCETCGKGYSIRSNYYDHLATHTGVKRNVCSICQKHFTFKPGLNAHMLRIHPSHVAHV